MLFDFIKNTCNSSGSLIPIAQLGNFNADQIHDGLVGILLWTQYTLHTKVGCTTNGC